MRWPWVILWVVLGLVRSDPVGAASATMRYASEEFGRREVFTFDLSAGAIRPELSLLDSKVLRVALPGVLALPTPAVDPLLSRFIERLTVEAMPAGQMGINLTIYLKEPYLDFRDSMKDSVYRLVIERYPVTIAVGPTRVLEGRVLAGRDGTLVVISFAGNGWVERTVDFGARVVQLRWPGASLGQGWRSIVAEGLTERLDAYEFARYQVEMEIGLLPEVGEVHFYRNAEAGTLIVELRTAQGLGRASEAEEIIRSRKGDLQQGLVKPLNRLTPMFVNGPERLMLAGTSVDEAYYLEIAQKYEQDYNYAKALVYVDALFKTFPETANREALELYRMDLVSKLDWNPGRKLAELETILAHYPNNHRYPHFRLMQLRLLNEAGQHENASAIMHDPALPKTDLNLWLERGRTHIGLRHWSEAATVLRQVLAQDKGLGSESAEANYLLARLAQQQDDGVAAVAVLDGLSRDHQSRIANHPEWLMEVADIYFQRKHYTQAIDWYVRFITSYPEDIERASLAILRVAGANRALGRIEEARRYYERLLREFPETVNATWARIFKLQLDTERNLEERLAELDAVIKDAKLPEAVVEAYLNRAILLGDAGRHYEAMGVLKNLLTLTAREEPVARANQLMHRYMALGMKRSLEERRPEYAVALGEFYGSDWRKNPGFTDAKLYLGEALLRLNMSEQAAELLKGVKGDPGPELSGLAEAFVAGLALPPGQHDAEEDEAVRMRISREAARVRLSEAMRLAHQDAWEGIILLLEYLPEGRLNGEEQSDRLRLLARAEAGRGRFPQAVSNLERLLYDRPMGKGDDYFWYASLVQLWKGDAKALPAFRKVAEEAEDQEVKALARMRVGDILQRKGETDSAEGEFLTASKLIPGTLWSKLAREIRLQLGLVK